MKKELIRSALAALTATTGLAPAALAAAGLERIVLQNGLEVILARKTGIPLVTVEIAIRAGAFIETPDLDGLTHLHEHMFFKANRAIPDQDSYLRRLDELGMSWNGSTSHEVVRYFFTLPSDLLREGMEFMRDAIQSPLFLPEELEKERKVVIGEYDRNEANPLFHLNQAVERAMFGKYFSRKNVIGDRQVISTATREKLQFIQEQFYVPNNAALIIAGEFEPAQARQFAEEVFGGWERRPDPFVKNPVPRHPPLESDQHLVVEQPVRSATALLSWHGPSVGEDSDGAVLADVIATALNHPTSRFHRALVDSGLATRAVFSYYTLKHVGPMGVRIEGPPEKILAALSAARREIRRLAEPGYLSADELARAAQELITQDAFDREKSREFAIHLAFWWSVGGVDSYLEYPEKVRGFKPADVEKFARRYLGGGSHPVAALCVSPESRQRLGISPATIAAAVSAGGEGAAADAESPATAAVDLPNRARLILRRIPGAEVASIGLYFRDLPARSRAEEAGIEQLLLQTLAEVLERKHPEELARLGARVRSVVQPDFSMIGLQCLKGGLEEAAGLLLDTLRRAELLPEDLERNRSRMIDAYRKTMDNPEQALQFVVNRTFYPPGHPYLAYPGGTEETLKRLTPEGLRERRAVLLSGSRILLVLASDLDPRASRALAERAVGDLPAGEPSPRELPELAGPPGQLTLEERGIPTCYVLGKFRVPPPGHRDFEALSLALSILHRKMFLEVRTRRALTYAVASGITERGANFGILSVSSTRPNEALSAMYAAVDSLIAEPLPENEFRGAALALTTRYYLRQESTAEQADALALWELVAGDHQRALDLRERLEKVKQADVQRVLKEYIRGVHFGVIGPKELVEKLDRKLFTGR